MKVLVVNHNRSEDKCISALTNDSSIEFIRLGYPKAAKSTISAEKLDSRKLEIDRVNATDPDDVAKAAAGMDCVVDMAEPWMSPYVKQGAMQANVSYINPKDDYGFWQQFKEGKRRLQSAPCIASPEKKSFRHRKHI